MHAPEAVYLGSLRTSNPPRTVLRVASSCTGLHRQLASPFSSIRFPNSPPKKPPSRSPLLGCWGLYVLITVLSFAEAQVPRVVTFKARTSGFRVCGGRTDFSRIQGALTASRVMIRLYTYLQPVEHMLRASPAACRRKGAAHTDHSCQGHAAWLKLRWFFLALCGDILLRFMKWPVKRIQRPCRRKRSWDKVGSWDLLVLC